MKKYLNPEINVISLLAEDVITASPGTETGIVDESNGIWDLEVNAN